MRFGNTYFNLRKAIRMHAFLLAGAVACLASGAAAAETKSFVMYNFWHAANSVEGDCKDGLNLRFREQWRKGLEALGYTPRQIEEVLSRNENIETQDFQKSELLQIMLNRGRVNGQPVNAYAHPLAVADSNLKSWDGQYAYGFDLDGTGATTSSFEDPETHEKGVKHQLARVLGCTEAFRARLRDGGAAWLFLWSGIKDSAPAWTITISGEDLSKDGAVTIKFGRAMEPAQFNGNGTGRADLTYRADPDPRYQNNVYEGKIEKGVISITKPGRLFLVQEPLVYPRFTLEKFRARMEMNSKGVLELVIGGYQPIDEVYHWCGGAAADGEMNYCVDPPGVYHLLSKFADADPDPKSGRNRAISASYYLEAVPAFVIPVDQQ